MHGNTLPAADARVHVTASRHRRELLIGLACGCAVILLFSGFTLVSRLGMRSALAPADLAALRFGIGGLLLLPFFARFGLSGLTISAALALCFLGGLGFALFAYAGFFRAPASHGAVLLHGTLPFFRSRIPAHQLGRAHALAPFCGNTVSRRGEELAPGAGWQGLSEG